MILVKITGGLGNQMFQYAAGRRLSNYHKTELKLDISHYQSQNEELITKRSFRLNDFNIVGKIAENFELREYKHFLESRFKVSINKVLARCYPGNQRKYIYQRKFNFHSSFLSLPDNVYLDGYWQSERYFADIKNIIVCEFTLRKAIGEEYVHLLKLIQESNSVAIHIRRDDYVQESKNNLFLEPCSTAYYFDAITEINKLVERPRFFLFSDDVEWVEGNLKIKENDIIASKFTDGNELADFILMSSCKHYIIANSSFSWWAAWLGKNPDKIIYAPKRWYKNNQIDTKYLIPDKWKSL